MVKWVSVNSTAIRKVGYDSSIRKLYIDFEDSDPYYTYCGVPQHVFEQFYRTQESKEIASGSGLGLAIVKNIIDLHDLSITLESKEQKGTHVKILF